MSRVSPVKLIICEPTPRWAVLMRRFAKELPISEARSLALADDILRDNPGSAIAVAVTDANAADVLLKLSQWQRGDTNCVTAALLDNANADLELGLREAGAQLVVASFFELPLLARLMRRQRNVVARRVSEERSIPR